MVLCLGFFFFTQTTAYEMRISDWSSDVCLPILTAFELSFVPSGRLLLPVVVSALPVIPRLRSSGKYWYPASRARRVQTYGQGSSTGSWLLRPSGRRRLCLVAHTWTQ